MKRSLVLVPLLSGCWQEGLYTWARCGTYELNLPAVGESIDNAREACGPVPGANGDLYSDDSVSVALRPWHRETETYSNTYDINMTFVLPGDVERGDEFEPEGAFASVTVVENGEVLQVDVAPYTEGTVRIVGYGRDDRDGVGWDAVNWKFAWDLVYGDPTDDGSAWYVTKGRDWVGLEPPESFDTGF